MMDEQLRDSVDRLLRDRVDAPSPEFLDRMESALRRPAPRDRWNVVSFLVAASLLLALVTLFVRRDPGPTPGDTGPKVQESPEFDDVVLTERSHEFESFFLRGADAVAVELTAIQPSPGVYCGVLKTAQRTTWRVTDRLAGKSKLTSINVAYLLVAGSRYLRGAQLDPDRYSKGTRRILVLAGPNRDDEIIEDGEDWPFLDLPDTAGNRRALQALATRAKEGAARLRDVTTVLEKAAKADPVLRGDLLDGLARQGRALLPFVDAARGSAEDPDLRRTAWELQSRIEWDGHPELADRLHDFVRNNRYAMLRPVDSKMATGRKAIELADDCLRLAPRAAMAYLLDRLDDETEIGEKGHPLACQNALCLLIEITGYSTDGLRTWDKTDASREHNAKLRQEWKSWWRTQRLKPSTSWCFGLTATEKSKLKMMWLPDRGDVETFPKPLPILSEADLAFAKQLGHRAVPFLLRCLCIDPPRMTLWETGSVEWNPTALTLLDSASGRSFGTFDPAIRTCDGSNKALLEKWKEWWREVGGK